MIASTKPDPVPDFVSIRLERRKTVSQITSTINHNLRIQSQPNINPSGLFRVLHGPATPEPLLNNIKSKWPEKRRKDAVLLVEGVITVTAKYFVSYENSSPPRLDQAKVQRFEQAGLSFASQEYGHNLVSLVMHADEYAIHLHFMLTPLLNGKLNAKKIVGNKACLSRLQDKVGRHFAPLGLERGIKGSKATHMALAKYQTAVNQPLPPKPGLAPAAPEPLTFLDSLNHTRREAHERAMEDYKRKQKLHRTARQEYYSAIEQLAKPNIFFLTENKNLKKTILSLQRKIAALEQASRQDQHFLQQVANLKKMVEAAAQIKVSHQTLLGQLALTQAQLVTALDEVRLLRVAAGQDPTIEPDMNL